jgi:hypothetical protein
VLVEGLLEDLLHVVEGEVTGFEELLLRLDLVLGLGLGLML